MLAVFDIEEVYDKKGETERKEKENHIQNCIETLTKDLPENTRIDVPMEFQQLESSYN